MKLKPPPGKRLVRDWIGLKVRTLRKLTNGLMVIPKGTIMTVKDASPGLRLQGQECEKCGVSTSMSRVSIDDVEIV